jgi:hypothetical protein
METSKFDDFVFLLWKVFFFSLTQFFASTSTFIHDFHGAACHECPQGIPIKNSLRPMATSKYSLLSFGQSKMTIQHDPCQYHHQELPPLGHTRLSLLTTMSSTSFTRSHLIFLQLQSSNESICEFLLRAPLPIVSRLCSKMSLSLLELSLLLLEPLYKLSLPLID